MRKTAITFYNRNDSNYNPAIDTKKVSVGVLGGDAESLLPSTAGPVSS